MSLLNVASKCYTSILNARLYLWLEENATVTECQAGFYKNYSTVDQTFNICAIVQKCLKKNGQKLYVTFVDFRKAFDSVRHDKRLDCIRNQGIKGMFVCVCSYFLVYGPIASTLDFLNVILVSIKDVC